MNGPRAAPDWIETWRRQVVDANRFLVEPMELGDSGSWSIAGGRLRHRTGPSSSPSTVPVRSSQASPTTMISRGGEVCTITDRTATWSTSGRSYVAITTLIELPPVTG